MHLLGVAWTVVRLKSCASDGVDCRSSCAGYDLLRACASRDTPDREAACRVVFDKGDQVGLASMRQSWPQPSIHPSPHECAQNRCNHYGNAVSDQCKKWCTNTCARWYTPVTGRFMTQDPYAGEIYR
jgi:hypothetical protein